ncbi:aldo/keto reductase [Actinoplanes couchii]|uniref:Oxidoreductase n=1 Tax=Actinoplanes couchii TaxID=403638 RepID=A0ABQ3XQQ1_9ACTN|nr:aldo/keto reductase [Actinoplanes couchii]MDR6318787.1 2,5-diketo-D-gluconate reductase A [Actinoplanes couchii]GID60818.1 oxidoreductase [Actinoplanes couchii]
METTITVPGGHRIPRLGFGTYQIAPHDTEQLVSVALRAGYRHIDTARYYRNEAGVGAAVQASGLARDSIWITSKLPIGADDTDDVNRAIDATVDALGTHVDLYLIHWPMPRRNRYPRTWQALRAAQADGRLSGIGVSNFHQAQLDRILAGGGPPPMVHQIEAHPHLANNDLRQYGAQHGIATAAWSPLGAGSVLRDPAIQSVARELGRTPAQIIIRWHLQRGDIVLPKASSPQRIADNAAVFDFSLDPHQMARIDRLDRGEEGRTGPHPERL